MAHTLHFPMTGFCIVLLKSLLTRHHDPSCLQLFDGRYRRDRTDQPLPHGTVPEPTEDTTHQGYTAGEMLPRRRDADPRAIYTPTELLDRYRTVEAPHDDEVERELVPESLHLCAGYGGIQLRAPGEHATVFSLHPATVDSLEASHRIQAVREGRIGALERGGVKQSEAVLRTTESIFGEGGGLEVLPLAMLKVALEEIRPGYPQCLMVRVSTTHFGLADPPVIGVDPTAHPEVAKTHFEVGTEVFSELKERVAQVEETSKATRYAIRSAYRRHR